jgi:hypothetical protein
MEIQNMTPEQFLHRYRLSLTDPLTRQDVDDIVTALIGAQEEIGAFEKLEEKLLAAEKEAEYWANRADDLEEKLYELETGGKP